MGHGIEVQAFRDVYGRFIMRGLVLIPELCKILPAYAVLLTAQRINQTRNENTILKIKASLAGRKGDYHVTSLKFISPALHSSPTSRPRRF